MKFSTLTFAAITLSLFAAVVIAQEKDGWSRIAAGDCDSSGGSLEASGGKLYYVKVNAWTQCDSVNLHTGTKPIQMNVANGGGDSDLEVWVGDTKVGVLTVGGTGGWNAYETKSLTLSAPQSGVRKVKLVFANGNVSMDWFTFSASTPAAAKKPATDAKKPATVANKPAVAAEKPAATAKRSRANTTKLRVIMMSDFPPIGVVKGGNVPNTIWSLS